MKYLSILAIPAVVILILASLWFSHVVYVDCRAEGFSHIYCLNFASR